MEVELAHLDPHLRERRILLFEAHPRALPYHELSPDLFSDPWVVIRVMGLEAGDAEIGSLEDPESRVFSLPGKLRQETRRARLEFPHFLRVPPKPLTEGEPGYERRGNVINHVVSTSVGSKSRSTGGTGDHTRDLSPDAPHAGI